MGNREIKEYGFTIIELIIVIAITAVIIVGSYGIIGINFKSKNELELTTREIISVLRNAQDRSISQEDGSQWGVHFENPASDNGYYLLYKGTSTVFVLKKILRPNIKFLNPSIGSNKEIEFSFITGFPNASTDIVLSLKNNQFSSSTIMINSNGQIQYK